MKNLYIILLITLSFANCKSDDEMVNSVIPAPSFLIDIYVQDGYYAEDWTTHALLTDINDNIVSEGILTNGNFIQLVVDDSLANEQYNLTFISKLHNLGTNTYFANTFLDVKSSQIRFEYKEDTNPLGLKSDIRITGTDGEYSAYEFPYFNHNPSIEDNASYTFELRSIPEEILFTFKLDEEETPRYVLLTELVGEENLLVDISETDFMESKIKLNYPQNDLLINSIWGYKEDVRRQLSSHSFSGGFTNSTHFYPSNIYTEYKLNQRLEIEDKSYETITITDKILDNYTLPDLNFEIKNDDPLNFSLESFSDYNYYRSFFSFGNSQNNVQWNIHGIGEQSVNFSIPDIFESFDNENIIDFSLFDLEHVHTIITKYESENLNIYGQYINYILDSFSKKEPYNKAEFLKIDAN